MTGAVGCNSSSTSARCSSVVMTAQLGLASGVYAQRSRRTNEWRFQVCSEVRGRLTQCATARPHARQCRKNRTGVNSAN
jgi:hypothetical protein